MFGSDGLAHDGDIARLNVPQFVAGHDNDGQFLRLGPASQIAIDIPAADTRQSKIEYHDVRAFMIDCRQRRQSVGRHEHAVSRGGQETAVRLPKMRIVFDDKNGCSTNVCEHGEIVAELVPSLKQALGVHELRKVELDPKYAWRA